MDKLDQRARQDFEYEFFTKFAPAMEKSLAYRFRNSERMRLVFSAFQYISWSCPDSYGGFAGL